MARRIQNNLNFIQFYILYINNSRFKSPNFADILISNENAIIWIHLNILKKNFNNFNKKMTRLIFFSAFIRIY